FDFYCLVDSFEGADLLEAALNDRKTSRGLQVLLELGMKGGRAGVRDLGDAHRLAEHIALSPNLRLRGIEAFEGIVQEDGGDRPVRALVEDIAGLAEACLSEGLFAGKPILTAGGSAY